MALTPKRGLGATLFVKNSTLANQLPGTQLKLRSDGLYKVVIADHKLQEIDGAPLTVRNAGTQDIYALDVEWPQRIHAYAQWPPQSCSTGRGPS
jgi:hypothetical protein